MNDIFQGIIGAYADRHQEEQKNLLTQEMDRRKQLAEFWRAKAEDPNDHPEARDVATRKYMAIAQTPFDKKLPKGIESLDDWLNVAPKKGQSIPGGQQTQFDPQDVQRPNMQGSMTPESEDYGPVTRDMWGMGEKPSPPPGATGFDVQMPSTQMGGYALEAPTPPPGITIPHGITNDERMNNAMDATRAQNRLALDLERQKIPIAADRAYAEKQAETRALYTPENLAGLAAAEEAKRGPTILSRGQVAFDKDGRRIAEGLPAERGVDDQILDAAAQQVAARHGLNLSVAPGVSVFESLPTASMKAEAVLARAEMDDTADQKAIKALELQHARLLNQETQLRINDLKKQNDPERFSKYADLVNDSPDTLFTMTAEDRSMTRDAMLAKGYPVPRNALPATMQNQESNARLSLAHVQVIRDIIKKYPDITGPVIGRAGLVEEQWGAPFYSARRDPERAKAEQLLRTNMKYLIARDLRALIGARPPQDWMKELRNSSPNQMMGPIFLAASLDGVSQSAELVLDDMYLARYGNQPTAHGRNAAPTPVPGTTPPPAAAPAKPGTTPAPAAAKVVTRADVQDYAKIKGITLATAMSEFKTNGFTIR